MPPEEKVLEEGEEKEGEVEAPEDKSDEKFDKIMERLEGLGKTVEQQGQRIDLMTDDLFSSDKLDEAAGRKEEKATDKVDYEALEQPEFRKQLLKEVNEVLQEAGTKHAQAIDHIMARVQIQEAIGRISEEKDVNLRGARKEFFANKEEILKALQKYDKMTAYEAYDHVVRGKPPEKKEEKEEKKETKPPIKDKGEKPGGRGKSDLEEKSFETTKEAVEAKFDELFPEDQSRPTSE